MKNKKQFKINENDIAYEEEIDESGFEDYIPPAKDSVAIFSFTNESLLPEDPVSESTNSPKLINEPDDTISPDVKDRTAINSSFNRKKKFNFEKETLTPDIDIFDNIANGSAPTINGEKPSLKRTYKLRPTTIKKLNELIAIHSDPNTYVSTIVDIAIEFYYNFIKDEKIIK